MLGVARGRGVSGGVEGGPSRFTTSTNQPIKSKSPQKNQKKSQNQLHNSTQLISKSRKLEISKSQNLKISKTKRQRDAPIKDSGAKRAGPVGARAAEEEVPDRVRERLRLRVGREAHRARRAAEAMRSLCRRTGGGGGRCVGGEVVVVVYEERSSSSLYRRRGEWKRGGGC